MTTVAVSMVRDEEDIVTRTVAHMLDQVDAVIVADNLSHDGTRAILEALAAEHPGRLVIVDDYEPAYRQSEKMTELARRARADFSAEWIVPFDADEWWYSPFGRIADVLAGVAGQWLVVPADLYDHVATGLDPVSVDPVERLGWRRKAPAPLPKVACRWRADLVIEQGNHGARYDGGPSILRDQLLVVRHFPYRSAEQLVRKVRNGAAAYAAGGDTIPATFGTHWRQWGEILERHGEPAIAELFTAWYWRDQPGEVLIDPAGFIQPPLIFDPAPGS